VRSARPRAARAHAYIDEPIKGSSRARRFRWRRCWRMLAGDKAVAERAERVAAIQARVAPTPCTAMTVRSSSTGDRASRRVFGCRLRAGRPWPRSRARMASGHYPCSEPERRRPRARSRCRFAATCSGRTRAGAREALDYRLPRASSHRGIAPSPPSSPTARIKFASWLASSCNPNRRRRRRCREPDRRDPAAGRYQLRASARRRSSAAVSQSPSAAREVRAPGHRRFGERGAAARSRSSRLREVDFRYAARRCRAG